MINPTTHFRAFIRIAGELDAWGDTRVLVRFSDEQPIQGEVQVICTRSKEHCFRQMMRTDIASNLSEEIARHGVTQGLKVFQQWSANEPQNYTT